MNNYDMITKIELKKDKSQKDLLPSSNTLKKNKDDIYKAIHFTTCDVVRKVFFNFFCCFCKHCEVFEKEQKNQDYSLFKKGILSIKI